MYDPSIGRWNGVDALAESQFGWTPFRYGLNNPIIFIDPDGNNETDFFDSETGEFLLHVEDGIDQVVFAEKDHIEAMTTGGGVVTLEDGTRKRTSDLDLSNENEGLLFTQAVEVTAAEYGKTFERLDFDSDLGKVVRMVYAEMSGITNTDVDREIVAESIMTRAESDHPSYKGKSITELIEDPKEYNAATTDTYKNGPYAHMNGLKSNSKFFYNKNSTKIQKNFQNAVTSSFKAYNGLSDKRNLGIIGYTSPGASAKAVKQMNKTWNNIANQISGRSGVNNVYTLKK